MVLLFRNILEDKIMFELLSPAGNMEKLKTAFRYGADACYMAGKKFGLRAFSGNFEEDELKALALASEKVKEFTDGKTIIKTIVVPKKLVNIVVK